MLRAILPEPVEPAIRAEQIRLLYHQGATIQVLGIFTAIVSVAMLWAVADHHGLLIWLLCAVAITLVRLAINVAFARRHPTDDEIVPWGRAYVAGTFAGGLVWGALALFFDPAWPAPYQVVLFVIYTGITAGAFNTNTPYFVAFPMFYLPPVGCLMFVMLQHAGEGYRALAALFVIYIVLMYLSALKFHNHMAQSLKVRFDNEQLANKLARSNQMLTDLANLDELTKLDNRRSMDRFLDHEWVRHQRSAQPLSLLYIDIDYFKQYNDSYGHDAGDHCLVEVAHTLKSNAQRMSDMAARFGGEEFAIILPETASDEAQHIAEQMRNDVKLLHIPHCRSAAADHVTISVGVATMVPQPGDSEERLRIAADRALYQAKEEGRDRVCVSP